MNGARGFGTGRNYNRRGRGGGNSNDSEGRNWNQGRNRNRRHRGGGGSSNDGEEQSRSQTPNQGRNRNCRGRGNFNEGEGRARSQTPNQGQGTHHDRAPFKRPWIVRPMGFQALQELLKNDDPEDLLLTISDERRGFGLLLEGDMKPDLCVMVVSVLHCICAAGNRGAVVKLASKGPFLKHLAAYVASIELQDDKEKRFNKTFWDDPDKFWNEVTGVARAVFEMSPQVACDVLPKLLKTVVKSIPRIEEEHSMHISDGIKGTVDSLYEAVEKTAAELQTKRERSAADAAAPRDEHYVPPVDDYRELDVYPSSLEITTRKRAFHLNKNRLAGAYGSVAEYLDVQFRLLREDFVAPLREAICNYIENTDERITSVKFYKDAMFLNRESVNESVSYRVRFDARAKNKRTKINYAQSKRFMFGALVCFTQDRFRNIIFGKIAERDVKDLEKGEVVVSVESTTPPNREPYLMVECAVYFEPYYQVLKVLQNIDPDYFPMRKYLIEVQSEVDPPDYILTANPTFYQIEGQPVFPLNFPGTRFYGLNDSQLVAFRAALTKEMAIIQGPPGTGKTFVGLKIAETLLANREAWYKRSPILLICYTNHALDQFLEGIVPLTTEILRVGGQSKNEALKNFNIRFKKQRTCPAVNQKRREVRDATVDIKNVSGLLDAIDKFDSVLQIRSMRNVIPNYEQTWFAQASDDDVTQWLIAGKGAAPQDTVADELEEQEENDIDEPEIDDRELEDDDVLVGISATVSFKPILDLQDLNKQIREFQKQLKELRSIPLEDLDDQLLNFKDRLEYGLAEAQETYTYLKAQLQAGSEQDNSRMPRLGNTLYPSHMPPNQRWRLYFHWLYLYRQALVAEKDELSRKFRDVYQEYNELRSVEDAQTMKEQLVVGMTTTGAARMNTALQALKSPIVIVEEAAEVLEAHIVSALTPHCQHLILIGDHQQLKPSTADYSMEIKFGLGVSLFERMVLNGVECHTLNVQHRMRREISALISPTIYPNLRDHESVLDRPAIAGLDKNLFFVDHREKEEVCSDTSKKNTHEARFLVALAKHLVLNGHAGTSITILAAYLGQMYELMELKRKNKRLLGDVRVAVLDNYQGEECDIILLSLVRSNNEGAVGFLKIENRVCVALSRARNGFYISGNMELLAGKCEIWPKIKSTLEAQEAIGDRLMLVCQVHPRRRTAVRSAEDFDSISEGGCDLICDVEMPCGHSCKSRCHIQDRDHAKSRCLENCTKLLCDTNPSHVCLKRCYEECGPCKYLVARHLDCDHTVSLPCHIDHTRHACVVPVTTTLLCRHVADRPCHKDPELFRCPHPCDIRVDPCGHACAQLCHIRKDPDHFDYKCRSACSKFRVGCTTNTEPHRCPKMCFEECSPCNLEVKKTRTVCPHVYKVMCCFDVDEILCEKPCTKTLPCGHKCKSKCHEPCGLCDVKVEKTVPGCDHKVKVACHQAPDRKFCRQRCPRELQCGHRCKRKCNEECTERCEELVDCELKAPCGHVVRRIPCNLRTRVTNGGDEAELLRHCEAPCDVMLKCEHACAGSCGRCRQGRVHAKCSERCGVPLVCDHECPIPCRESCKPCQLPCGYRCRHSRCGKRCGEVCTACSQPCDRRCAHQRCKRRCGELCDVPPCWEPCAETLPCGHPCVGLCGDACPRLCRKCDRDELTVILFGNEDEPDACFVELKDCGHVLESEALDNWFSQDDEVKVKCCPQCKTPVTNTPRYSDYLKQAMIDVERVKRKLNGEEGENDALRQQLKQRVELLRLAAIRGPDEFSKTALGLSERLSPLCGGRNQRLLASELNAVKAKIQILEHIRDCCLAPNTNNVVVIEGKGVPEQVRMILDVLAQDDDRISNQEIDDIKLELTRLQRMVQFQSIVAHAHGLDKVQRFVRRVERDLFTLGRYSKATDDDLVADLRELNDAVKANVAVTDAERRQIVAAMGMSKGHWFKCPNGHVYCIGDCGGAMVESKCNECGATIGGGSHRLRDDNALATEMDGATHAAWSQQVDLRNYRF